MSCRPVFHLRSVCAAAAALAIAMLPVSALGAHTSCPLAGERPMQVVHLFFGRAIAGRKPLSEREWDGFAATVLTPNFPDGFTVYDAMGQWQDTATHVIVRERSKVVLVADTRPGFAARLASVTDAYRNRFHQISVGVITETACAAF